MKSPIIVLSIYIAAILNVYAETFVHHRLENGVLYSPNNCELHVERDISRITQEDVYEILGGKNYSIVFVDDFRANGPLKAGDLILEANASSRSTVLNGVFSRGRRGIRYTEQIRLTELGELVEVPGRDPGQSAFAWRPGRVIQAYVKGRSLFSGARAMKRVLGNLPTCVQI